ncbi:hypothetical protein [Fodinibius saliphilus]|uniref:hypothetical protein n=1 Tax=Fodinibius saliphilus TaxID=1920650 RepID=UPI0011090EED|nr:hypothetical protein [Fodinibius saliphilus]
MDDISPVLFDYFQFKDLQYFLENLTKKKCVYYASEVIGANDENLDKVEPLVQHTLEVFKTLNISTDEHFYLIFRYKDGNLFKDWKISELASIYMLFSGDPTSLETVAQQQNQLIDLLLEKQPHKATTT